MYLQDIYTSLKIRLVNDDTAVKTSRTKQCLIEHFRPVGRCQYQQSARRIETIHLRKQLIQCLLTLIISSSVPAVTALSDRIDLIDKDDTRCVFLCFLKQITDTRCTDTDEHLHEI